MKNIYLKHLHLLARMKRNPITQENTQIVYRKSQNLRDLLVTGIINKTQKPLYRCTPCRDQSKKDCISCDRIVHSNTIAKEHLKYKIRGYFNCQSENCIYCLICNCCNKRYIGESSQTVNNRLHGHESHIRKSYHKHPGNPVAQHFGINLNKAQDYKIQILDQESDKNRRLRLEEAWIFILKTSTPDGLNTKW